MAAVGLPLALLLGFLAEVIAGLVGRVVGRRGWREVTVPWVEGRRLVTHLGRARRADVVEAGGALASMVGAGLASAAALGAIPGSAALVYLGLAVAAAGGHLAASAGAGRTGGPDAARARLQAVLAEPAFLAGLGAAFLRWRTFDLAAAAGTQTVLGPGIAVGSGGEVAGLVVAGLVVLVAGTMRLPRITTVGVGPRPSPAAAVLATLGRWAAAGATVLVTGGLLGGADLEANLARGLAVAGLGAAACAVVLGLAMTSVRSVPPGRPAGLVSAACLAAAAGSVWLVVSG
jgi:hypothetical protein